MKDVILSFSTKGRENYHGMLERLIESCKQHWSGDMLIYSHDNTCRMYASQEIKQGYPDPWGIESLTHQQMPYQFKVAMIQKALELGYRRIIWLDSSMQLKKDLTPLFDGVNGMTFFENLGHPTWKYISDTALAMLKNDGYLSDTSKHQDIVNVPQVWGGAFALNFSNGNLPFFNDLKEYSLNGSFKDSGSTRPGFITHRHDQAVMSVLLNDWAYTLLPYGQILCPPHDRTGEYGNDPYLICRGL